MDKERADLSEQLEATEKKLLAEVETRQARDATIIAMEEQSVSPPSS